MTEYQKAVEHYARMARNPGFIDHARIRCRELEQTDLYAGISQDVARALKDEGRKS